MELENVRKQLETGDFYEVVTFPNGRGVSIINERRSAGMFELAVLDSEGELDYSTPVTGDVLRFLTVEEVLSAMKEVSELPAELES